MAEAAVLVRAIEDTWAAIRKRHPEVPEVILTVGAGSIGQRGALRLGHFAAARWVRGEESVHELFVGGEGLERGAQSVLGTLLHEAAHGLAAARGIEDTSRQGRYHNKRFKVLAEELGIEVEHSAALGYSSTSVPSQTATAYRRQVEVLTAAITAYRRAEFNGAGGGRNNHNGRALVCGCGRKVRASVTVAEAGPITCGLCGTDFEEEEQ